MASEPDRLILSARERQVLADLEAALQQDAPDLEASLSLGRHRRMPRQGRLLALRRRVGALALPARLALSAALVVAGLAVMLLTFTSSIPLALLGVAMSGVGLWAVLHTLGGWRRRRGAT